MSGENGDKSQRQTSEEIEHHIEVILFFHQPCSLVHKGREGSESSAESRGEQQFGRWRHPSGLHHLRNPISHAASEEAANAYYQYFFHLFI